MRLGLRAERRLPAGWRAGEVEALLETYDSQRKVLPPPIVDWTPGWTLSAEAWNGRIAILALVLVLLLELSTGRGVITNVLAL